MDGVCQMNKSIVDKHKNFLLSDCVMKGIKYEKNDICLRLMNTEYGSGKMKKNMRGKKTFKYVIVIVT